MKEWLNSVYSDGTKFYVSNPTPKKGESITIKLKVKENQDLQHVLLRSKEFGAEIFYNMEVESKKNGIVYYQCEVQVKDAVFQYQFYLVTKDEIYYYTQYRMTDYIPEESNDFRILVDYDAPSWVRNTVFYQIFPDRFCNGNPEISVKNGEYTYQGHGTIQMKNWNDEVLTWDKGFGVDFYGGDLAGIEQKLDYLQELGVNAIYLNPIFISPTHHRYDSLDYTIIDPHLGGEEALESLSNKMHERGMKLILDISINHTSSDSKWFNKDAIFYPKEVGAFNNKDSEEREYYFFDEENNYDTWFGTLTMPKLNYTSKKLREIIYKNKDSILKKWMQPPFNIDGWRFDVADVMARNEVANVYHEVWSELCQELKKEKKEFYILAEDWADCAEMFEGTKWDATMNYYGVARPIREFLGCADLFNERNSILREVHQKLTARQLKHRILQFYAKQPSIIAYQMFNLFDSHDVFRLHNYSFVQKDEYEGAMTMLFTLPGAPSIYYGDEKILAGRVTDMEGCRYPMDWSKEMSSEQQRRYFRYQTLAHMKTKEPILGDGGFQVVYDEGYIFGYTRFTTDEMLLIVVSTETEDKTITIELGDFGFDEKSQMKEVFSEEVKMECKGTKLFLVIPAHKNYLIRIQ